MSIVELDGGRDASLRDPADQQVLGTFLASKADYLITGDKPVFGCDNGVLLTMIERRQQIPFGDDN